MLLLCVAPVQGFHAPGHAQNWGGLQVVVDTAEAGKALLARGKLRSRVTLIPLDKVRVVMPLPVAGSCHHALHAVSHSRQLHVR